MSSEAAAYLPDPLSNAADADIPAASFPVAGHRGREITGRPAAMSRLPDGSDEDLLLQVGNGSKDALSVLFRRHATPVFSVARRILRDAAEAEDLVQELFLFVFQKAELFDPTKGSAASWIIQMAYHRAIDRRRYLGVRHHYDVQDLCEERHLDARGQSSIDELAAKQILHRLRCELSAEQRQTLELHLFEGYTFREIAERTGQTFGNVRHHYYRSLERLRSYIFEGKTGLK
jgi:RNA polymerase sigma-70 factor (ECF subfamily)